MPETVQLAERLLTPAIFDLLRENMQATSITWVKIWTRHDWTYTSMKEIMFLIRAIGSESKRDSARHIPSEIHEVKRSS
jgi:hypothetical protein